MKISSITITLVFIISSLFTFGQKTYTIKLPEIDYTLKMVPIPSGYFNQGNSDKNVHSNASPLHKVKLDGFWMSETEIPWDLYQAFIDRKIDVYQIVKSDEVILKADAVSGATTPYIEMSFGMGSDGYPAISMTQLAAAKFCEWLSAHTGDFYRLPTEAEWEYACRAGSETIYSFGDSVEFLDQFAWFSDNSGGKYHKVGTKKPNAWGLYDMHGNVSEWTLDAYSENGYPVKAGELIENPWKKPNKLYPRVVRGGAWTDSPRELQSTARKGSNKKWKKRDPQIPKSIWWHTDAPFLGFRIVRPYKTPDKKIQQTYWNL